MIKIIETNLMMRNNEIMDCQSRVVEVENWESYIEEIRSEITVSRYDTVGRCHGSSFPNGGILSGDLKVKENSLMYNVMMKSGNIHKKLAYRCL